MGQKHRQERAKTKAAVREVGFTNNKFGGFTENEFGELVKKTTKAEARRTLLRRHQAWLAYMEMTRLEMLAFTEAHRPEIQRDITNLMTERVHRSIEAELFA